MGNLRIGYQGTTGSNSEEAAKIISKKLNLENTELLPLVTSKRVVEMLKKNEIDYGVMAVKNSIGGIVQETSDAIKSEKIEVYATETLHIHHCLFVKDSSITVDKISKICSHPQALIQCNNNIKKLIGEVLTEEIEDTAIGAQYLVGGMLGETVGVICRLNAGIDRKLHLLLENIEDKNDNETEFRMFINK